MQPPCGHINRGASERRAARPRLRSELRPCIAHLELSNQSAPRALGAPCALRRPEGGLPQGRGAGAPAASRAQRAWLLRWERPGTRALAHEASARPPRRPSRAPLPRSRMPPEAGRRRPP
eukprot:5343847-Alexandrium_andersonii.AAC.1